MALAIYVHSFCVMIASRFTFSSLIGTRMPSVMQITGIQIINHGTGLLTENFYEMIAVVVFVHHKPSMCKTSFGIIFTALYGDLFRSLNGDVLVNLKVIEGL